MKELAGDSALILGYGREGKSVHRYLRGNYPDKKIGVADREIVEPAIEGEVELHLGQKYLERLLDYDIIIRSPGIPLSTPAIQKAVESGRQVTTGTNIFFSECPGMVVGITGTKGKSTTSSLIYEILKTTYPDVRLVGNIGEPALDHLPGANDKTVFVAELSSHQLEDAHYSPHIAVVLAVVPEHLSYHGSFAAYAKAKGNITKFQSAEDAVVFNPANPITDNIAENSPGQKFKFSIDNSDTNCYTRDKQVFVDDELVMSINEIPLLGPGNLENVLAAVSVGRILGVGIERIREAIMEFKPLPHRLEYAGEKNGIIFYNDSLATIPEATINALEALGANVETLIAGGYDRGLDFPNWGNI